MESREFRIFEFCHYSSNIIDIGRFTNFINTKHGFISKVTTETFLYLSIFSVEIRAYLGSWAGLGALWNILGNTSCR